MSLFSGIGDFFRGVFGEDDEEKKRRKERERRESQQRAEKKRPTSTYQPKSSQRRIGSPLGPTRQAEPVEVQANDDQLKRILNAQTSAQKKAQQQDRPKPPQQSLFDRLVRDKIDANTKADQFAREQRGEARDYRQSKRDAGEKDYTNPAQRIGYSFAEPIARGVNTIAGSTVGAGQAIGDITGYLTADSPIEKKAALERMRRRRQEDIAFSNKGGLLGVGGNIQKRDDLEDKRKLLGTILQTGGDLSTLIPTSAAVKSGTNAARQQLQKEILANLLTDVTAESGRQIKEGKFDPQSLALQSAAGVALPLGAYSLGRGFRALRNAELEKVDIPERSPDVPRTPAQRAIDVITSRPEKVELPDVTKNAIREVTERTRQEVQDIGKRTDLTPQQKVFEVDRVVERYQGVVDELETSVAKTADNIAETGKQIEADQAARQATVEKVQQAQEEAIPAGQKPIPTPEDKARNFYEETLFSEGRDFVEPQGRSVAQTLSPDRILREKVTNPLEALANRAVARAQTSENSVARGFGRFLQGFSREAGVDDALKQAKRELRGGIEMGKLYRERIADLGKDTSEDSMRKIYATLDPEQAKKLKITNTIDDLTPEELVVRNQLKQMVDNTSDRLYTAGLISEAQWKNGDYLKRAYSVFEDGSDAAKAYSQTRSGLLNQFKKRKDVDLDLLEEAITDPFYLVAKKSAEAESALAMVKYGEFLQSRGLVSDVARPGYVQLPNSKLHGPAAGKYVPLGIAEDFTGFQFNSGMLGAFNDLVTAYDSLAIRRGKKAILTILNPAVRGGNQFSNRVIFANMNGINPVQFNYNYMQVPGMIKRGDQLYREAVAQGLTGIDITQADFARRLATYADDPNIAKKAIRWIADSYSKADDQARIAAYVTHRKRGYSPNEAARLTQRGFQDYKSVGFFYDLAAKTPLIGNAFVRFAGDSIRLAKNAALDHPLRSMATVAMWATFVNQMSQLSGESEEDKATREGRFGAPKIPFTDISMAVQTPWGEVNVSRFLPFYQLNDVGGPLTRFSPIQGNPLSPQGWQDPLLGQFGQIATDQDFRGKSIQDPDNVKFPDGTTKYDMDKLSDEEKKKNIMRFLFNQNMPLGREADSLASSKGVELFGGVVGDKDKEDIYGKSRSGWQALLRSMGVKVEQYGQEQAQKQRETEAYFDRRDEIEAEVAGLPPEVQAAYRRLTGQYKLREQKDNPFEPGTTVDKKAPIYNFKEDKWREYMQYPELYDIMEKRAIKEFEQNGTPIKPEFDQRLPKEFRLQIIQEQSTAPGDDLELYSRMRSDPRWDTYERIKDEYKEAAKAYYPESNDDGEYVDDMLSHQDAPFPKKPPLWQAYTDARAAGVKPEWNDALQAARDEYEMAKLRWTNDERRARGLPAIPYEQWVNETFGYKEDDGNKSGYGYGYGGGGRGSYKNDWGILRSPTNTRAIDVLDVVKAQQAPQLAALLKKLQAGQGGRRRKPPIGGASKGRA